MKPSRFRYVKPASLHEAFDVLEQFGDGARVLAGGQSLLAGLGMRLAAPEVLMDINGIEGLSGIRVEGDEVVIGALTRHVEVLNSPIVAQHLPLVAEAITHVAHVAVRNRGTFGGSLAYADPAAELPACTVAHGGTVVVGGRQGRREVRADDFFLDIMQTALQPGELILEIRLPVQRPGQRHVFAELSRRHGDFALVGLAGLVTLEGARVAQARLVYFGCVSHPQIARATSAALLGCTLPLASFDEVQRAMLQDLDPDESPGMRAETKLELAAVVTRRHLNALQETH
ncbi:xanthine dehydrogenase family protein subunit M (plasmid) [Alicycliphilus denitrificans]|uniref:Xanthine dehydrogenase family protein subunit M n=1 Tax=Alicycliphilus denitrificans TaxID=179636 RepID=A0A858ZMT2_9BURK|nr:xanthine dehydrogenase family protein subunit M [Alicycliphilus denitrificans]QKD42093.1 xanthine dehydrogenase family protein subunit M [Alicycliphilus denitrificans]QKD42121.1 xanthine dehydrogenase family protein subunit M [Alicycliphilus denitrificans]